MDNGFPEELLVRGRLIDPNFSPEEKLYIRFNQIYGGKVAISEIKYPDQSMNRSKYSEPYSVLYPNHETWGYGFIKVQNVPGQIESDTGVVNYCMVEHEPCDLNYSHSIIAGYKNGRRVTNNNKNRHIVAKFRYELIQRIEVIKTPELYNCNEPHFNQ